ncbi:pyrroline-5-carboxylate reductase [Parvicella tangerina]|uniref:Pyrroline-5-carboxylate reductase n=1 Tax=Parvicella tangerina TaxID=2829795 RepID=A0A916JQ49_9FLAO|nr:pyrroline-5-carboxylate reductase [Parvicella tangerina]CAG5086452.1 Pyrroline-5-carboxylate reductase [Parvicella tangerina]
MTKIGIIGAGNLGRSLARGLVRFGNFKPDQLLVTRRNVQKLDVLKKEGFRATESISELVNNSEIIFIAVLPQQVNDVLEEIKPSLREDQLIISLVTGIKIAEISSRLNNHKQVVRAMPNTAIAIGESMTCLSFNETSSTRKEEVKSLFNHLGQSIVIQEEQMTSATALCACGTAFFLRAIRAAMQGGTEIDFHADEALLMAAQTAKGAAMLLLENGSHPEDEIDRVTSPKGCTIAGLNNMEHSGFSSAFIKGITTSANMAKELY